MKFISIPAQNWGFQPLEPLAELRTPSKELLGTLYKTYRNDPVQVPGKPIWVYMKKGRGGWAASSEHSEADLREKILSLYK